jgi:AcrR family transcriptional regulator
VPRGGSKPYLLNPRKQQILDAGLKVFVEHGVAGASIEQIRDVSGASTGSIYHHFGSKEGLAGAVYVECLVGYQQRFLIAVEKSRGARPLIEAGVRQHLAWVESNRERAVFLTTAREALTLADAVELREFNRRFFGRMKELLAPWFELKRIKTLPLNLVEAIWIGPSQELTRHWLAGRLNMPLQDHADALAAAAWNGLKTDQED